MPKIEAPNKPEMKQNLLTVVSLTKDERGAYWDTLKKMGLWYEPYKGVVGKEGLVFPYGEPIILSKGLTETLSTGAKTFRQLGSERVLSPEIFHIVRERAPILGDVTLSTNAITSQLVEKVQAGMGLPINFDIILAKDSNGNIVPKVVELQLAASAYVGWFDLMTKAVLQVKASVGEKNTSAVGNPVRSLESLKNIVPADEEIIVIDFNPLNGPTSVDTVEMSKILGDSNSLPVSIGDIMKDDSGKWVVGVRDGISKEIVGYKPVKNVLCRSLQGDINACLNYFEETFTGDELQNKVKTLQEFFTDSININWIWHPSFQEIINKKDLSLLGTRQETKGMETKTYLAGEKVKGPGKFFYKFLGGNSGKGVNFKELMGGDEFIVEENFVLQEAINIAPISMPVIDPKTGKDTTMLATVEIRTMPPFNFKEDPNEINTFFLARLNFRRIQDNGKRYIVGDLVDAPGIYWLKDLKTQEIIQLELNENDKSTIPSGYEAWQTYGEMAKTNVGEIMLNLKRLVDKNIISYEEGMNLMRAFGFPPVFVEK